MKLKNVVQLSIMVISILVVFFVYALSKGFEYRIAPYELESQANSQLPIKFSISANADVQLHNVREQVRPRNCDDTSARTNLDCRFRNAFISPVKKAASFLGVILDSYLERLSNRASVDASIRRVNQLYIDADKYIHATAYISVLDFNLPVDIIIETRINSKHGIIEMTPQLSEGFQGHFEKWKVIIEKNVGFIKLPFDVSEFRLNSERLNLETGSSYNYRIDLKKQSILFTFIRPFLKDIELSERGLIVSYGL